MTGGAVVVYKTVDFLLKLQSQIVYLESQTLNRANKQMIFQGLQMFIILVILDTNWAIIAGWTGKHTTALYFIGLEEIIFITIVFSLIMFNCIAFKDKECETKENPLVSIELLIR